MSNVVMITYLTGRILSQAAFPSMEACLEQRQVVLNDNSDLKVYCVYADKKQEVDPEYMLRLFDEMVRKMRTYQK
jgi:hypothetical protein